MACKAKQGGKFLKIMTKPKTNPMKREPKYVLHPVLATVGSKSPLLNIQSLVCLVASGRALGCEAIVANVLGYD